MPRKLDTRRQGEKLANSALSSGAHENTIHWNQVNLLIPNLGSTSLKYQILEMPSETVLAKGRLERVSELPGGHRADLDGRRGDRCAWR